MCCTDRNWHKMVRNAELQQQEYYELMPEWTIYQKHEYKYLRQNIGFALFGPPVEDEGTNVALQTDCSMTDKNDVTNALNYTSKAQENIDIIFKKVCKFGEVHKLDGINRQYKKAVVIYYGVIYNITFRNKNIIRNANNSKEDSKDKESDMDFYPIPVFKILNRTNGTGKDQVWYIDAGGRVYQSWQKYIVNNTLPKCTMVFPRNGIYQPNPSYKISEEYSRVWIEVKESPACNIGSTVVKGIDKLSSVVGIVGIGFAAVSLFTPAAPAVLGAAVASGLNGAWMIGRSVQNLADRRSHEESISLRDRNALSSWIGITGSVFGLASGGGAAVMTRFVQNGNNINTAVRTAYNVLVISSVGINFVGISYQAFCMYERYQEGRKVSLLEVASLVTHILFFGNAVVNLKFAGELIESTQGKVLDDYSATLRSKNLRRQFNRAKREAATNNVDKVSENAQVIRYINRKQDFKMKANAGNISMQKSIVVFEGRKIKINGISLLDPMIFVEKLIASDANSHNIKNSNLFPQQNDSDSAGRYTELRNLLKSLFEAQEEYNNARGQMPNVDKFDRTFDDLKRIKNGVEIFLLTYKIACALIKLDFDWKFIEDAVHFVWVYIKESVRRICSEVTSGVCNKKMQEEVDKIVLALFENMEATARELKPAFKKYISKILNLMNIKRI